MSLPMYTPPPRLSRRERFALWRRTRPFWGGLSTMVAGIYLWSLTAAPIDVVVIQGVAGISAIVICVIFVFLTVVTWVQPHLRVVTGGIVVVLALAAILLTNLGGFLVGTLLALHGGASMAAWKPTVQRWQRPTDVTAADEPSPRHGLDEFGRPDTQPAAHDRLDGPTGHESRPVMPPNVTILPTTPPGPLQDDDPGRTLRTALTELSGAGPHPSALR